jgi:hypothetical protein
VAVDVGVVAPDEARLLQRAHAPPAGRGRQAHALGQFGIGQARIGLQVRQDGYIEFVQSFQKSPVKRKILAKNT